MVVTDHPPPPISSNNNTTTTTTTSTRSTSSHNITDEQNKERIEFGNELRPGFVSTINPPIIDGRPNPKVANNMGGNRNNLPYCNVPATSGDDGTRRFNLDTLPPPLPSYSNPRFRGPW